MLNSDGTGHKPPDQMPANGLKDESGSGSAKVAEETETELESLGALLRRRSPVLGAELDGRVMARIRHTPRARLLAVRAWWLRPRTIKVSPLGLLGAGAAAALVLIGIKRPLNDRHTEAPSPAISSPATPMIQAVQFALAAPGALQVNLVGDFNGWDATATPLQRSGGDGVWAVEVPLAPGRHEYAFVVNGREWRPDPAAPRALVNEFGAPNSVITVGAYRL
jgi:Carbohydrate-binding module 48 (Isoamylase N-terminal domain)